MREMISSLLLIIVSCISLFPVQAGVIRLTGDVTSRDLNRILEYLVDEEGALQRISIWITSSFKTTPMDMGSGTSS
jgi:hypothetical protein